MRRWFAVLLLLVISVGVAADAAPWRRRRRADVRPSRRATSLVTIEDWGAEPRSPETVDPERFARAIRELCGWMPPGRATRYGGWIQEYAAEFEIDPFLLGGVMHRMGRCNPRAETLSGIGLTAIPRRMYGDFVRRGAYTYWVLGPEGTWLEQTLRVDRFPFSEHRLRRPQENLYFAAAFLRVWREQAHSLAQAWEQHPHRHYVSHFVWGDRVRSDRAEDRILLDRRRLLQYYGTQPVMTGIASHGRQWAPPLDGAPRVISSWIGAERDDGARSHRGVDVESVLGEPVRAIAAGRVNFAGVDFPGRLNNRNMSREEIEAVPRQRLGRGGRYVCILHRRADMAGAEGGAPEPSEPSADDPEADEEAAEGEASDGVPSYLRSCYMHLEDVEVAWGQEVAAGERIGTVGRTGMLRSAPHLHLELHGPEGLMDPSEVLAGYLIGHPYE